MKIYKLRENDEYLGEAPTIPFVRYEEAQAKIDALKAELAALKAPPKVLSAEDIAESGLYWWRESPSQLVDWGIVEVGELWPWEQKKFVVLLAGEGKNLFGEFIGPIPIPEV